MMLAARQGSRAAPALTRSYILTSSSHTRSKCMRNLRYLSTATATSQNPTPDPASSASTAQSDAPKAKTNVTPESASSSDKHLPLVKMDEKKVHVGWDLLTCLNFWLRDHCRCPECFHQITKQWLVDKFDIPPEVQPANVEATEEGLRVTWPASLKPHSVALLPPEEPLIQPFEKVLWGATIVQDPPSVANDYVMNEDRGLWKLLRKIETFGFCFTQGVEATPEATERFAVRVANIRSTQYGTFWDFTSDLAKGDTAYTTLVLGAHTDTTYFVSSYAFSYMSTDTAARPSSLTASTSPPSQRATPRGIPHTYVRYPILNLGPSDKLYQVRYNHDDRSAMKGVSSEVLEKWYEALRLWNKTLKSADSEYWVQLSPGTAVTPPKTPAPAPSAAAQNPFLDFDS
ncbi:hypothetical protein ACEPAI_3461 [Sanghuangporus weigelae]